VYLTATEDPGWTFTGWTGDLVSSENPDTVVVVDNTSITGNFSQMNYTLATNVVGSGSIGVVPDQPTYVYGDTVYLSATPDPGWAFAAWTGDLVSSENPDTLIMTGHAVITGTFSVANYVLTTDVIGSGLVSVVPDQPTYLYGDTVYLSATPDPGWAFAVWTGDLVSSENPDTVVMVDNTSITGNFSQMSYTLATNVVGSGSLGVVPDQPMYVYGDTVYVTATADPGWMFSNWMFSDWAGDVLSSENPDTLIMRGNAVVTGTFLQTYTLTIGVNGSGSVSVVPDQPTYTHGDTVFLTGVPDSGFVFVEWTGDLTSVENPDTILVTQNTNVTANFDVITYSLSVTLVGNGQVTKIPDKSAYSPGEEVILSAVADSSWVFLGWSGDLTGEASPDTVVMNGDVSITATFSEELHTVTVTAIGNGSVTVTPNKTLYAVGERVFLDAVAGVGSEFQQWSGDLTGSANPDTLTITGDMNVTATFDIAVGIDDFPPVSALTVRQNYPNPFRAQTTINYGLPATQDVAIDIFDVAGRRVRSVRLSGVTEGWHTFALDSQDIGGRTLKSGVYFYRVKAGGEVVTHKMVIMR
jgi:uncharacterized repeat protein (TIGR02543 family)